MDTDTANFDRLAHLYRWMEYLSFGPMLERCRFQFLAQCTEARQALVLGDGDGRFTARLLATNPHIQVDAIDSSAAMLKSLRCRVLRHSPHADTRLHTVHADIRRFEPGRKKYDLVVSHFFLDCLTDEEVSAVVERFQAHCTHHAIWLVSEFSVPQTGWLRAFFHLLVRCLYLAFSWMTGLRVRRLPDYGGVLACHGFSMLQQRRFLKGLLVSQIWQRQ